jgi:hypothetical protein
MINEKNNVQTLCAGGAPDISQRYSRWTSPEPAMSRPGGAQDSGLRII